MIYIYIGSDLAYSKHLINQEIRRVNKGEYELIKYSAFDDSFDDVVFDATSCSLSGNKKIIVYDNCFFLTNNKERMNKIINHDLSAINELLDCFDGRDDFFFIVPSALQKNASIDRLRKSSKVVNVEELKEENIISIASNFFSERNIKIDTYALKELAQRVNKDFGKLICELQKLENAGEVINSNDIAELVSRPLEDNVFNLTTYLFEGKTEKTIALYRDLLIKGNDSHLLLAIIANQVSFLSQVSYYRLANKRNEEIASILKCHPYRVKVSASLIGSLKPNLFYRILNDLFMLDRASKLENDNIKNSLELFLVEFKYKYLLKK